MRAFGSITAFVLLLAVSGLPAAAQAQAPKNKPAPKSWTMAAEVLAHLEATKDYRELRALYDRKAAADANWLQSAEGQAVDAQLKRWRSDAAATVIIAAKEGRTLRYSIGGVTVTDPGTSVVDLEKSLPYRRTIAEAIAQNILTSAVDPKVQAALASFRNESEASSAGADTGVHQAQTKWTLFQQADAGYRIEFPGTPVVKRDTVPSRSGPAPHVEATLSYADDEYSVELTTYASRSPPEAVLDLLVNSHVNGFAKTGHLRSQMPLKIGALPARRIEIALENGPGVITILFVTDGTRVFEVRCIAATGSMHSANVAHFIDSFALVPQSATVDDLPTSTAAFVSYCADHFEACRQKVVWVDIFNAAIQVRLMKDDGGGGCRFPQTREPEGHIRPRELAVSESAAATKAILAWLNANSATRKPDVKDAINQAVRALWPANC